MRLIVVSNRLPFTIKKDKGQVTFSPSAGGLATGLSGYLRSLPVPDLEIDDYLWLGWAGDSVTDEESGLRQQIIEQYKSYPVEVPDEAVEKYYHGFSNQTIWPLFHSLEDHVIIDDSFWQAYRAQNQVFADTVAKILKRDDIVWIHDFHLMLVPKMLRDKGITNPIGFFLHIPFPGREQFGKMPAEWVREILDSINKASLSGFHIPEYAENFAEVLSAYDRRIHARQFSTFSVVEDFPIGIKFEQFYHAMYSPLAQQQRMRYEQEFAGKKIISSVDRLDYTKGIPERLAGFRLFLEKYSEWHGKFVYYMVVVPSRGEVGDYGKIKQEIEEMVAGINRDFASSDWEPIQYLYDSIPFERMAALYNISAAALVTPLKDGMNLVAKEFVAAKADEPGMLILSKFAGAAEELTEALLVDPHVPDEIAEAINQAFTMPQGEQIERNRTMQEKLKAHSISQWAADFLKNLIHEQE